MQLRRDPYTAAAAAMYKVRFEAHAMVYHEQNACKTVCVMFISLTAPSPPKKTSKVSLNYLLTRFFFMNDCLS